MLDFLKNLLRKQITRAPTEREGAQEKLQFIEERFRLLVEGVRDYAIFMLDPQGRIVTWNIGTERLKGYTADEIIGQHFSVFYPPEDVQKTEKCWPIISSAVYPLRRSVPMF